MTLKEIKDLIKVFNNTELSKIKIEKGDFGLVLEKGGATTAPQSITTPAPVQGTAPTPVAATPEATPQQQLSDHTVSIASPMVGTFYRAPSPDSPPFVKKGDVVKKGQTLCILEAMKIMNELEAEFDCKIVDILVEDGQPVEYDMPLFLVEKV